MTSFSFTFSVAPSATCSMPPCQIHGLPCRTALGWDEAHTDSGRPYTLDELEDRPEPPHRFAYPDADAYTVGFYIWRQIRRDGRLNEQEAAVRFAGVEERIKEMTLLEFPKNRRCPDEQGPR
jgi:hypothetical protein